MIIGITGGSGCGKTTLLNMIRDLGSVILDCDAIYHRLLATDQDMLNKIGCRFPGVIDNGVVDRKKLGEIVFSDPNALLDLNQITHSAVKKAVLQELSFEPSLAAIDAIGLFEGGLAELCDVTVAVTAPNNQRIARLVLRDGITPEYAKKRISAQHDSQWFQDRCDYVLENDSDLDAFATKCLAFLQNLGIMKEKS